MKKRAVAICCFVWAGAILSASPANAKIFSANLFPTGTSGHASAHWEYSEATVCAGEGSADYAQRMNIGGSSMLFLTDQIYPVWHFDVYYLFTCNDGTNVYEAYSIAASNYPELTQPASLDRLSGKADTQLAGYRLPLRQDEPEGNAPAPSSALAGEHRRRHSLRPWFTLRG